MEIDDSSRTLPKKVREAQLSQYNFILVVGQEEMDSNTVNVRTRDNEVHGAVRLEELVARFTSLAAEYK